MNGQRVVAYLRETPAPSFEPVSERPSFAEQERIIRAAAMIGGHMIEEWYRDRAYNWTLEGGDIHRLLQDVQAGEIAVVWMVGRDAVSANDWAMEAFMEACRMALTDIHWACGDFAPLLSCRPHS